MRSSERQIHEARRKLAKAVQEVAATHRTLIDALRRKATEEWNDPEFIWKALLSAFSTLGNSRGAKLVEDLALYRRVRFDTLRSLEAGQRRKAIRSALVDAGVSYRNRKTDWAVEAFERILAAGGPERVKEQLVACRGRAAKIRFLKTFKGIGDKYARDIMMDAYAPDFRESVAIDSRLKKVGEAVGVDYGGNYREAEQFFLEAAHEAGLSGWELDRTIYHCTNEVLDALGLPSPKERLRPSGRCRRRTTS